jgi:hypothetical protein
MFVVAVLRILSLLTDVLLVSVWKVMRPVRGFECSKVTGFVQIYELHLFSLKYS